MTDDPIIGTMVDEYQVESLLGRGGMGAVYKAHDTSLRRTVALKVLLVAVAEDEEAVKRFDREARIIAGLNHPNLAQIFRVGTINGTPYFAMEYISGKSLVETLRENRRLGGMACVRYMVQAAQGLKAAADANIIHRDIKPGNIMITDNGVVKIVDFGLAKGFAEDTFQTQTGMVMGTPRYMSPEQGRGQDLDHRADIYSLGATFYHMVTGQAPFSADNPMTLIMKHMTEPVTPITELRPNVPEKLCNIIYGMMMKNREERIGDYNELIYSLEGIFDKKSTVVDYGKKVASAPAAAQPLEVSELQTAAPALSAGFDMRMVWVIGAVVAALCLFMTVTFKARDKAEQATVSVKKSGSRTLDTLDKIKDYQADLIKDDKDFVDGLEK